MSKSGAASLFDATASLYEDWKYGPGKNLSIVRSSSSIVSTAASSLLVWILFRPRNGIKTTYHRLLLGLSVSDFLFSLSQTTFGAVVPRELSYVVWNAGGSQASCDVAGFANCWGTMSGLLYTCSLNLYYLAKVKFNKTDSYIAKKLEPWFHAVPMLFGSIVSIILLPSQGINASINGVCGPAFAYDPPHCDGHEDGDVPEGFEIPCGRGKKAQPIIFAMGFFAVFLVPITVGGSLWMIYRSVLRAEQKIRKYGAGSLHPNRAQSTANGAATANAEGGDGGRGAFTMLSTLSGRFGRKASRTSSSNKEQSQSRAVLRRAAAYSVAYFVTYIWLIVYGILSTTGAWMPSYLPWPKWAIPYSYVTNFFNPLQGLWTLLVYMQPNVYKRKRSSDGNVSWFKAFVDALWSAVTGGNDSARREKNRAGGRTGTRAGGQTGTNPTPESASLLAENAEEEDREVQECEPSV